MSDYEETSVGDEGTPVDEETSVGDEGTPVDEETSVEDEETSVDEEASVENGDPLLEDGETSDGETSEDDETAFQENKKECQKMPPKKIKMTGQSGEHMKNVVVKNEGKDRPHKCVMCEATLPSKNELQAHFRLHANGQIDRKGRCMRTLLATKPNKALVQSKERLLTLVTLEGIGMLLLVFP